mmetsp:Transcript_35384/g.81632  ORF Transcript_35384/g.81632 Transcript_35384/m.81632 type:complete len:101 (+) Transcript_35384:103-405(+)
MELRTALEGGRLSGPACPACPDGRCKPAPALEPGRLSAAVDGRRMAGKGLWISEAVEGRADKGPFCTGTVLLPGLDSCRPTGHSDMRKQPDRATFTPPCV